jgi:putative ABC transport system permease protein
MKNWWFNSTNTLETDGYNSATIRAADVHLADSISAQLRREGFQVQSIEAIVTIANRIVTAITLMFTLVASIGLLVAAIGITNTMVMAIYERTREIGILKAMGASSRDIRRIFMFEAGFIGMIGGVIGLLTGWLMGLALNQAIPVFARMRDLPVLGHYFVVSPTLAIGVIVFAALIGVAAGFLPAQRASSLNPLEALRHE